MPAVKDFPAILAGPAMTLFNQPNKAEEMRNVRCACDFEWSFSTGTDYWTAGRSTPMRTAMIPVATVTSINVKPRFKFFFMTSSFRC